MKHMKNKRIIIAIILGVCFIILSLLVFFHAGILDAFDTYCYNLVTMKMNDFFTNMHHVFTFLGSTLFIIILTIFFFILFLILKKKNYAFIVALVIILSTVMNNVVKLIIRRARPQVLQLVTEKSFSFPSGHTMAAVSLYGILLYLLIKSNVNKKIKIFLSIILGIIPVLVGISRIYLGAHFTSDIMGGALLSLTLLMIEIEIINRKNYLTR